jgi:hypothetical protein
LNIDFLAYLLFIGSSISDFGPHMGSRGPNL